VAEQEVLDDHDQVGNDHHRERVQERAHPIRSTAAATSYPTTLMTKARTKRTTSNSTDVGSNTIGIVAMTATAAAPASWAKTTSLSRFRSWPRTRVETTR
jgi:hypothetical protein